MRRTVLIGASLLALSGCGGSPDAVGENSAGSIKTTAVGEVVANVAAPTPTPIAESDNTAMSNDTAASADVAADAVDNSVTSH